MNLLPSTRRDREVVQGGDLKQGAFRYFGLVLLLLKIALLAGCASTHNFKTDGSNFMGGGFYDEEIRPGLHRLTASGNHALWPSFSAAAETWKGRADKLCGANAYQSINTGESSGKSGYVPLSTVPNYGTGNQAVPSVALFNATIFGYILCNSANMTREEALKYLDDLSAQRASDMQAQRKKELDALGGADCEDPAGAEAPENHLRRGKVLVSMGNYDAAMRCFLRAQEKRENNLVYKAACTSIGMMYELGWGVTKNMLTANEWFKKAGL